VLHSLIFAVVGDPNIAKAGKSIGLGVGGGLGAVGAGVGIGIIFGKAGLLSAFIIS
jgi:F-type H+-transporting ATPase subunit c